MSEAKTQPTPLKYRRRLDYIDVDTISANEKNPREPISKKEVADILESIKTMGGVLVPIVVYKEGDKYILLDGERRWRACKKLSKEYPKYRMIPANIIAKPPTDLENLQTMFNIHQKRKEWSTSAKAEAVGRLLELKGDLSVGEIEQLTGLDNVSVNDSLLLLNFPKDVREKCLSGELDEFYPILLGRNLKTLRNLFPSLFEEYSWNHIADCLLMKAFRGFIRRARDFNKLGQMAKTCIRYQSEGLFEKIFHRMITEERFTPSDAQEAIREELGYKLETSFKNHCAEFRRYLKSYLKEKPETGSIPDSTREVLMEIFQLLRNAFFQRKIS